jgi:glycosyl transferase family 25
MRTLWMNMDASPHRREHMERVLTYLGLPHERVPAVDTRDWSDERCAPYLAPDHRRPLVKGLLGNYLSHRKCWEMVLAGSGAPALVLEDDVAFTAATKAVLADPRLIPDDADVGRLESWPMGTWVDRHRIPLSHDHRLHRMRSGAFGTAAYIVTPAGATKLLEQTPAYRHAIDLVMYFDLVERLTIYALLPGLFCQSENAPHARDGGALVSEIAHLKAPKPRRTLLARLARPASSLGQRLVRWPRQTRTRPAMSIFTDPFERRDEG